MRAPPDRRHLLMQGAQAPRVTEEDAMSDTSASASDRAANREQTRRLPPRWFVRIAWVLHRATYSFTGGRFGLWRPETGGRFGTMRLKTIGRRSGQPRVAIVGYYEVGPDLVTLAMNGWAEAEPAWWLNLQALPDATVDLVDGSRAVRARAAAGGERERLWATFRDYPGWGDDIDALAARRSTEAAVVVLEPRTAVSVSKSPAAQTDPAIEDCVARSRESK